MSLDVYLTIEDKVKKNKTSGIFIRENGKNVEISHEEWNERYPNHEPVALLNNEEDETHEVYHSNITHNLGLMAKEAGLYEALWRPHLLREEYNNPNDDHNIEMEFEESCSIKALELIEPLRQGLHNLKINPNKFKKFNPENGWGSYDTLVEFAQKYLDACYEYPNSKVEVWR